MYHAWFSVAWQIFSPIVEIVRSSGGRPAKNLGNQAGTWLVVCVEQNGPCQTVGALWSLTWPLQASFIKHFWAVFLFELTFLFHKCGDWMADSDIFWKGDCWYFRLPLSDQTIHSNFKFAILHGFESTRSHIQLTKLQEGRQILYLPNQKPAKT